MEAPLRTRQADPRPPTLGAGGQKEAYSATGYSLGTSGWIGNGVYGAQMHTETELVADRSATIRWALALWSIVVAVYVVIAVPALRGLVEPIDEWFCETSVEFQWQPVVDVADALRNIGSAWVMVPFEIAVGIWLYTRRRRHSLVFWAAAVGLTEAVVWTSKVLYDRSRPPDSLVPTTGASFPSGHSTTAAVVAIGLVLLFAPIARKRRYWFVAAASWATLMAASRLIVRAHWFTDVVAGATLGAAMALTIALAVDRWDGSAGSETKHPAKE